MKIIFKSRDYYSITDISRITREVKNSEKFSEKSKLLFPFSA